MPKKDIGADQEEHWNVGMLGEDRSCGPRNPIIPPFPYSINSSEVMDEYPTKVLPFFFGYAGLPMFDF